MDNLIARLEAAEEGSRELDAEIHATIHGGEPSAHLYYSDVDCVEKVPRYTTSMDAALTLVPDVPHNNKAAFLQATLYQTCIGDIPDDRIALTLCAAALKARETI